MYTTRGSYEVTATYKRKSHLCPSTRRGLSMYFATIKVSSRGIWSGYNIPEKTNLKICQLTTKIHQVNKYSKSTGLTWNICKLRRFTYTVNNENTPSPWRSYWLYNPWTTMSVMRWTQFSEIHWHHKCLRNEVKVFYSFYLLHLLNILVQTIFTCKFIWPENFNADRHCTMLVLNSCNMNISNIDVTTVDKKCNIHSFAQ